MQTSDGDSNKGNRGNEGHFSTLSYVGQTRTVGETTGPVTRPQNLDYRRCTPHLSVDPRPGRPEGLNFVGVPRAIHLESMVKCETANLPTPRRKSTRKDTFLERSLNFEYVYTYSYFCLDKNSPPKSG